MAGLSDFFKLIEEEKKKQDKELYSLLGEEFSTDKFIDTLISSAKKEVKKEKIIEKKIEKIFNDILIDEKDSTESKIVEENIEEIIEEELFEETVEDPLIEKSLGLLSEPSNIKQQNDPLTPIDQKFATLEDLQNHYKIFISRIQQQLSTLGGSGETRLEFLDDVDRNSVKVNNKFLRYNSNTGKWKGSDAGEGPFISSTTYVTTSSYTILEGDYYIGVNYAGAVTITLPNGVIQGTTYIVKDELGEASKGTNRYITILPSGSDLIDGRDRAILAFDYGSLTFVYRNGWRVV
jgi:hypothetical protein